VKEQDFRLCEFCGCNTNARLRACCNKGTEADLAKGGSWKAKAVSCEPNVRDFPEMSQDERELRLALVVVDILDVLDDDIDIVPREAQLERIRLIVKALVKEQELAKESARAVLHPDAVTAWRADARELLVDADPIKRRLARRVVALADALDEEMAVKLKPAVEETFDVKPT
jgi:hypothetical protein